MNGIASYNSQSMKDEWQVQINKPPESLTDANIDQAAFLRAFTQFKDAFQLKLIVRYLT